MTLTGIGWLSGWMVWGNGWNHREEPLGWGRGGLLWSVYLNFLSRRIYQSRLWGGGGGGDLGVTCSIVTTPAQSFVSPLLWQRFEPLSSHTVGQTLSALHVGQIVFPFHSEQNTFSTPQWSTHYQHIHNGPFAQQKKLLTPKSGTTMFHPTLIKNKIKFSSYMRKFRMESLQSHILLTSSSYMLKYLRISSYIRNPFIICDFATALFLISLYRRKIFFSFLSV
jgi:hypothetical protein